MLILDHRTGPASEVAGELRLTYEWRQKTRCRVTVARGERTGEAVGIDLTRGTVLRDGEYIAAADGTTFRVVAATEQLLHVTAADALALMRLAYHLGNRHVPVQIGADESGGWLRLMLDHVLENMVSGLGGKVSVVSAPFDPESGAYGHAVGGGHGHHGHDHGHDHGDDHDHGQDGRDGRDQAHNGPAGGHEDRRHAPRIHDFTSGDA